MKKAGPYILAVALLLAAGGIYIDNAGRDPDAGSVSLVDTLNAADDAGLGDFGTAPEFVGIDQWLNSEPLTMQGLRGKVVLVDFWTYSCINCVRTFPYVTAWDEKYKDKGLAVVGVHTPEFAFEKDTANVRTAISRHGITYPVAQDNDFRTWRAYSNRYWPAHYLIDQSGKIVYTHFGEGNYQETEQAIQQLLGLGGEGEMAEEEVNRQVRTPEVYFGLARLEMLHAGQTPARAARDYSLPAVLVPNTFALGGSWSFTDEGARLEGSSGRIRLNFHSKDVHMVGESAAGSTVKVYVDSGLVNTLKVDSSALYTLFEGDGSGQHVLELEIDGAGLEAYTFTFG
jgi:thiol-disulfide isomerase/thioredoxin